jgi:hypothetical protein
MSDYKSGLPVRSEADGADERVQTKIVDATNPDTQQAEVDTDNNLHVEVHGNDPGGTDRVIKTSEEGSVDIDGVYDVSANTEPANIGVVGQERNVASSDTRQTEQITAKRGTTSTDVVAMDVSLHDSNGNAIDENNPLAVTLEENPGDEICDYNTSVDVAKDATTNHDYIVNTGKTFSGEEAWISGSGKLKVELQVEDAPAAGTFTTKFVGFNSTANPNVRIPLERLVKQVADAKVRFHLTNLDNQPQDLYSTLIGIER